MLFYNSGEKSPNWRTHLIFCHGIFVLDPDFGICISPYESGSDFYYTNPDPHHLYQLVLKCSHTLIYTHQHTFSHSKIKSARSR